MEELIIKAKKGDSMATEAIINKYMPLVISEASKYHIPSKSPPIKLYLKP
jgi:DNA-directed RNA polymerase specialized sigma subunit